MQVKAKCFEGFISESWWINFRDSQSKMCVYFCYVIVFASNSSRQAKNLVCIFSTEAPRRSRCHRCPFLWRHRICGSAGQLAERVCAARQCLSLCRRSFHSFFPPCVSLSHKDVLRYAETSACLEVRSRLWSTYKAPKILCRLLISAFRQLSPPFISLRLSHVVTPSLAVTSPSGSVGWKHDYL